MQSGLRPTAPPLAEHAALGKDVGNGGRTADGDEPGQDGHRADFSELRRHQDDGGSEHVEHHGHRELQTGHLRLFDRFHNGVSGWISFLVLVEKSKPRIVPIKARRVEDFLRTSAHVEERVEYGVGVRRRRPATAHARAGIERALEVSG